MRQKNVANLSLKFRMSKLTFPFFFRKYLSFFDIYDINFKIHFKPFSAIFTRISAIFWDYFQTIFEFFFLRFVSVSVLGHFWVIFMSSSRQFMSIFMPFPAIFRHFKYKSILIFKTKTETKIKTFKKNQFNLYYCDILTFRPTCHMFSSFFEIFRVF